MSLKTERYYPIVLGIIAGVTDQFLYFKGIYIFRSPELSSTLINLSGITIGFIATSSAIVYSISDKNKIVQELKRLEYFEIIIGFTFAAIYANFLSIGFSVLEIIIYKNVVPNWKIDTLLRFAWFTSNVYSFFASIRIISIFAKIFKKA